MPSSATGQAVSYANLDDKGRVLLSKSMRESIGLHTGSSIAVVDVGGGLLLVPQDAHLAELMENAMMALHSAGISAADVMAELPEARAQVVTDHYGADFFEKLRRSAEQKATTDVG